MFLSLSIILNGQEYPRVDTVNYGSNVSHVYCYSNYSDEKPEIRARSFWFDEEGRHDYTLSGYAYEEQTKTSYEYDGNGALIRVIEQSYQSPKNDSLTIAYWEEVNTDKNRNWDALHAKYDSLYEVVNPEMVNWQLVEKIPKLIFSRDNFGRDSLVEVYRTFHTGEPYLAEKVYFIFNDKNQLIAKKWINIKHPNIIEFNAFKPNTAIFDDSIKLISGSTQAKTYELREDYLRINYYVNGKFTGYEYQYFKVDNLITDELVFNTSGDTLSHFTNDYNENNLLKIRNEKFHSGYNGFDYSLDLAWGNITKYTYDSLKRIIQIDVLQDQQHVSKTRFEIFER